MRFYIILFLFFFIENLSAQVDYEFWFAAPELSFEIVSPGIPEQNLDNPVQLYMITTEGAANVTIDEPANPAFTPINVSLVNNVYSVVNLTPFLTMLENQPADVILNYGLRIRSDKHISCYYDVEAVSNGEMYVLKGRNALGREFIIPAQKTYRNYPYCNPPARNSFIIVATEDSTIVQIQPKKPIEGHVAGVLYQILLNKGQTYSARAVGGEGSDHLGGSWVYSNRPVAVTVADDEAQYQGSIYRDLAGDQLIPREICDTFYISATSMIPGIKLFYAFEDNTTISYNGDPPVTINRGDVAEFNIPWQQYWSSYTSNKPVLGYEVSFQQMSGNVLPPLSNCSGSYQISTCNTPPYLSYVGFDVALIARTADTANFTVVGPIQFFQPGNYWQPIPGTNQNWWRIGVGTAGYPVNWSFSNSTGKFQLWTLTDRWDYFDKAAYYGNLANLNLGPDCSMCPGDSILLDAGPGPMTYLWSTGATTETIWARSAGQYWVQTTENVCTLRDTINISYYWSTPVNLGPDHSICSGDSVLLDAGTGRAWYLWNTGQSTQTIWAKNTGAYWVKVPDVHCDVYDTVNVLVSPPPSLTNNPLSKTICTGESTNVTLIPSIPGATFNWTAMLTSGSITGFSADSGTVINQTLINHNTTAGVVTYTITPKFGNCIGTPADYVVTVNPGDAVNVSISASANNICSGVPVTFTATPTGTGALTYDWKVNGTSQGVNNPIITYTPANGDVVTCVLSSSITTCVSNNPATSNAITMIVNPLLTPVITVSPSQNNICSGTSVTFTASVTPSGGTNHYQWKVNNIAVGTDQLTYTYTPANGDLVTCDLSISNLSCLATSSAASTPVTMMVSTNVINAVTIAASANPVCAGLPVTFAAAQSVPGNLTYSWFVNGNPAGTNSSSFSYTPANADIVHCSLFTDHSCTTNNPANSNNISMSIIPAPVVSYTHCTDTITTLNARPFKLKGGIPLGGTYSGLGVNSGTGIFNPALAGVGTKTITYSYTNVGSCSSSKTRIIKVVAAPVFTCGNSFRDIRDNRDYSTVLIGSQCWFAEDLDLGTEISESIHQRDNCINEKYTRHPSPVTLSTSGMKSWNILPLPAKRVFVLLAGICPQKPSGRHCSAITPIMLSRGLL